MNIEGLNLLSISKRLEPYVVSYFHDCNLKDLYKGMFQECNTFSFEEITHLLSDNQKTYIKEADKFNGACGFLEFDALHGDFQGYSYTIMLLTDEKSSMALSLALQVTNNITGRIKFETITHF